MGLGRRMGQVALVLAPSSTAWACTVCGLAEEETANAMMASTIFLSLLPLAAMGIGGVLLYRLSKARESGV